MIIFVGIVFGKNQSTGDDAPLRSLLPGTRGSFVSRQLDPLDSEKSSKKNTLLVKRRWGH